MMIRVSHEIMIKKLLAEGHDKLHDFRLVYFQRFNYPCFNISPTTNLNSRIEILLSAFSQLVW